MEKKNTHQLAQLTGDWAPAGHPHGRPTGSRTLDVLVVGGGHAGVEAALAAARLGAKVGLVTPRTDLLGEMSCNPAIGGLGKGQLVREVDALGGVMGRAIDETGIQFRMLNTAKGFAVQAPRAQADRHLYRESITRRVAQMGGVELIGAAADGLWLEDGGKNSKARVVGLLLDDRRKIASHAVILATGTFLTAVMHTGEDQSEGGRVGERAFGGISRDLNRLGIALGRLKTGTPPRLAREGIDWDDLEPQLGDSVPMPFSYATAREGFPLQEQIACHITFTNAKTHALIRDSVHLSPMFAGRIQGQGPRYCPSVEDKVVRFPDRERHQIFLEPEGLSTDSVYVNGISTSLPAVVQEEFVHSVRGLSRARFLRHGYAVEYDFVQPSQLDPTFAVSAVEGLYLAGQINGTSGYEEAAAQGLLAGANAALWVADREALVLARHEAYAGVLTDDLVVSQPTEPYRMFSSRAEYRLLLRQDNADERLAEKGHALGLVSTDCVQRARERRALKAQALSILAELKPAGQAGRNGLEVLRRPEIRFGELEALHPELKALGLSPDLAQGLEADVKYEGYVDRQLREVARMRKRENMEIPRDLKLDSLTGLRGEAREKLASFKPRTLGAAGRIAGINPPDVALLAVHVERHRARLAQQTDAAKAALSEES